MLPSAPRRPAHPRSPRSAADVYPPGIGLTSFDDDTEPPLATRGGDGASPRERVPSAHDPRRRQLFGAGPRVKAQRARVPAARPGPASGGRWRAWRAQAVTAARHHWLVSVLLVAGLVLRVLAQIGYRPALLYVDSLKYLYGASPGSDPLGYRLVLKVVLVVGDLGTVAAIQHLLGLAMAVALYVVLLRRGVPVLAVGRGRRAGAAGRLPAADGADDHARRLVRGDDRGRAGRAALAAGPHAALRDRGGPDPRSVGDGQGAGRVPDPARAGLPAGGRRRHAPDRVACRPPWSPRSRCRSSPTAASTTPGRDISGWPGSRP